MKEEKYSFSLFHSEQSVFNLPQVTNSADDVLMID